MQQINFSFNWNKKLECDWLTTLRLSNKFKIGDTVEVALNRKVLFTGAIMNKTDYMLNNLTLNVCALDTGYGVEETKSILKRMYSDIPWDITPIYCYLIKKIKTESQKTLEL